MHVFALILIKAIGYYQWLLIAYAIMSWFPDAYATPIGQFLIKLVQPFLNIFDRYIPSIGGISFNVMIAYFVLYLAQIGIGSLLLK
ncbi:YggT family protein [Vaginisenegalia massiliensis]|uniref:YggT family protein n=1 Tax=Vaginisenegalia massiliensis TaxID=2058294 RepID=UPI000F53DA3F|nr:YggT family protein [Vaginisenegalia massiliensis]